MFIISLDNLKFHSKIGVLEQERTVGNDFIVNVCFNLPSDAYISENLGTTVSYAEVYDVVEETMNGEWLLLETVSKRIADKISELWPKVKEIRIKITKLAPPISGIDGTCSVEYIS